MRKYQKLVKFGIFFLCIFIFTLLADELIVEGRIVESNIKSIDEAEPNDTLETAQLLSQIGSINFILASINEAGDKDWYRFEAIAANTYTVELYNVALGLGASGYECHGYLRDGVGIRIFNPNGEEITNSSYSCDAWGMGNVHNIEAFTATFSGYYYVLVQPNNKDAVGDYNIRVLPKYDEPGADWNSVTYEPNNNLFNAYVITPGMSHALSSTIEPRTPQYSTFTVDEDWYRFEAVATQSYTVELFNVALGLGANGYECNGYLRDGVGIRIYDPNGEEITNNSLSCDATFAGIVHNSWVFDVEINGDYSILVQPNNKDVSGTYNIRVCENECRGDFSLFLPLIQK